MPSSTIHELITDRKLQKLSHWKHVIFLFFYFFIFLPVVFNVFSFSRTHSSILRIVIGPVVFNLFSSSSWRKFYKWNSSSGWNSVYSSCSMFDSPQVIHCNGDSLFLNCLNLLSLILIHASATRFLIGSHHCKAVKLFSS